MSAFGLESVLVGDVVDGVGLAVVSDEAVRSTDADDSVFNSAGLDLGGLVARLAVGQLVGEFVAIETDVVGGCLADDDDVSTVSGGGTGDDGDGGASGDLVVDLLGDLTVSRDLLGDSVVCGGLTEGLSTAWTSGQGYSHEADEHCDLEG